MSKILSALLALASTLALSNAASADVAGYGQCVRSGPRTFVVYGNIRNDASFGTDLGGRNFQHGVVNCRVGQQYMRVVALQTGSSATVEIGNAWERGRARDCTVDISQNWRTIRYACN